SRERGILENFLRNISVSKLISPNFGWADIIPERVLQPSPRMALSEGGEQALGWRGAVNGAVRESADINAGPARGVIR
ncbi:MAG: hypothetical protein K0S68_1108, partial [Candidatus Saccharibacteria bacterium]|nr:hypothetical protein [Candidatus Saccharibacteria bacterium]